MNNSQGAASLTVSRIWRGVAEPLNPKLRCISYCNCSTLGTKQPGDKAVWGQVGGCQRRWWWLKCGERTGEGATICVFWNLIERHSTQTRPAEQPGLPPLHFQALLSFPFLSSTEVSSQADYCTFLLKTSLQSTPGSLPVVRFMRPRAESLLLWLFRKCSASDITPLHHRRMLVKTAWITPNLRRQQVKIRHPIT